MAARLIFPLLLVAGAVSRFAWIGHESLWLDEALTVDIAHKVAGLQFDRLVFFSQWSNPHPAFYYGLMRVWIWVFGTGELALRALSAILGVALVGLTYYAGQRMISREVGMLASVLLLVNAVAIHYSQEARMYTLVPLLILASTLSFYLLITRRQRRDYFFYTASTVVMLYTDYLTVLLLAVHLLFLLVWQSGHRGARGLTRPLVAWSMVLVLYIPWLPNALLRLDWTSIAWMAPPTLVDAGGVAAALLGVGSMYFGPDLSLLTGGWADRLIPAWLWIWPALALLAGFAVAWRERTSFRALLVLSCSVPVVIFLVSVFIVPVFNLRQASVYLPALMLTLASGLSYIATHVGRYLPLVSRHTLAAALALPVILSAAIGAAEVYAFETKEDWRTLARDLSDSDEVPIVISASYLKAPFGYYYRGQAPVTGAQAAELESLGATVQASTMYVVLGHVEPATIARLDPSLSAQPIGDYRGIQLYRVDRDPVCCSSAP